MKSHSAKAPAATSSAILRPTPDLITRTGFTLIELMVVCAIMGIIALLVIPQLTDARQASRVAAANNLQTQLNNNLAQWRSLGGRVHQASSPPSFSGAMAIAMIFVWAQNEGSPFNGAFSGDQASAATNGHVSAPGVGPDWTFTEGDSTIIPSPSTIRMNPTGLNVTMNQGDYSNPYCNWNGQFNVALTFTHADADGNYDQGNFTVVPQ
jgi:prepilin-type N-terminal cleavage/methylation domain-containing protein